VSRLAAATRRLVLVASLALVPWSLLSDAEGPVTAVFAWGLVGVDPLTVTTLPAYLDATGALPAFLAAWPRSVALWLAALGAATVGAITGADDRRVTAALLALAGLTALQLSTGLAIQPGRTAYPTGALAAWTVAARLLLGP
jgi:uncharacterized protein (TIGR04206 family)